MSVEIAENTPPQEAKRTTVEPKTAPPEPPIRIEPDLAFIRALMKSGGDSFKKCMQCGTCSATCALASDIEPFPRKEMAWAVWGMKESLLQDPDVWLCHQCNDCSTRCPRGAKPGDVLAAVRQEWVVNQAVPRFLARWANQPQATPLLLGIMAALLGLALYLKTPIADALGISDQAGRQIVFSYSSMMPRWLLNGFFIVMGVLVLLPVLRGVSRLWQATKKGAERSGSGRAPRGLFPSFAAALKSIISHEKFTLCTKAHSRYWSHLAVFFGFLALGFVSLWAVTAPYNPLITGAFVYPFGFWSPWKLLANAGGVALIVGCLLMIRDRLRNREESGVSGYSDWILISALLVAAFTGFFTEALHYVRLEPHRHLAYFVHLVFAGALLVYMPYSKFAHIIYRTTALICAERYNRTARKRPEESLRESVPQQADLKYANAGQARFAVIVAALIFVPLAYSIVSQVLPTDTAEPDGTFLERPDPKYKNCVRDTVYMRFHHWELLRGIREEVVRYGMRDEIGLHKCPECHTSRERFCNRCHDAVSLKPDCFGCHYYP
jgi:quinone-modifying oxidoreductase subunit QmoC